MVRPNHDLPNLLVGGVRDYAEEQDLTNDQAHAKLLEYALIDVGILPESSDIADSHDNSDTDSDTQY